MKNIILPLLLSVGLGTFVLPQGTQEVENPSEQRKLFQKNLFEEREELTEKEKMANSKQTKAIIQGTQGTTKWSLDQEKNTLTFTGGQLSPSRFSQNGAGKQPGTIGTVVGSEGEYGQNIRKIIFTEPVKTAVQQPHFFWRLPKLEVIEGLEFLDTSRTTDMRMMFEGNTALTSLDLSGWDTSKVTDMSALFQGSTALASLDLSGWVTSNVTDMGAVFNSTALTSLDLSGWDTSNVTRTFGMFALTSLTSLDLSGWDTGKVTDMSYMFLNTSNLRELKLGKKTKFPYDTSMPNPPNSTDYTSRWVSTDGPLVAYNNSLTFLQNGTNEDSQTFVWERQTTQVLTPTISHLYLNESDFQTSSFVQDQQLLKNLVVQNAVEKVNYQLKDAGTGTVLSEQVYTPSTSADPADRLFDVTFLDGFYTDQEIGKGYRVRLTLLASKANPTGNPYTGPTADYFFETKVLLVPGKQLFTQRMGALDFGEENPINGAESSTGTLSMQNSVDFSLTDTRNTYDTSSGTVSEVSVNTTAGIEKIHLGKISDLSLLTPLTNQQVSDTWKVMVELTHPFTNPNNATLDANVVFHKAKISKVGASNVTAEIAMNKTVHPGAGAVPLIDGTAGGTYQFQKGEQNVFFDKDDIQLEIVNDVPQVGIYETTLLYTLEDSPNF